MKKIPYCVPEIIEAVLGTAKNVSDELFIHKKVINTVIDEIASLDDLGESPHELMLLCLRSAYKALGAKDPYEEKKHQYNQEVQDLYGYFDDYIATMGDTLAAKLNIAAALNYKGLCSCSFKGRDVRKRIKRLVESDPINEDNIEDFKRVIKNAKSIIYITASAGEIVADKLLIAELAENYDVKVAVAPQPVLSRATELDAEFCRIDKIATVVEPGVDMYGVLLEKASSSFREIFKSSDVVVVKGGVNSKTLNKCGRDYFVIGAGYASDNESDGESSEEHLESTIIRKYLKYIEG